jgi:hypothetical protein
MAVNVIEAFQSVMPGLVPGIHVLATAKAWMAGTSPAMTGGKDPENNGRIFGQALGMRALPPGSSQGYKKRNQMPCILVWFGS